MTRSFSILIISTKVCSLLALEHDLQHDAVDALIPPFSYVVRSIAETVQRHGHILIDLYPGGARARVYGLIDYSDQID